LIFAIGGDALRRKVVSPVGVTLFSSREIALPNHRNGYNKAKYQVATKIVSGDNDE